jgi:hypothetical protein
MSDYYIHFKGKTMDPCSLDKGAYEEAKRTWLCTGCCDPKPCIHCLDAHIQDDKPEGPLNMVNGCGLALARRTFLMQFGWARIQEYLNLGDVYGPEGNLMDDWVTFIGKHKLFIRGSKSAQHRVCSECGRDLYFAMGKTYLYPEPATGIELFQSHLWGLVLPETIVKGLGIDKPKGVWVERLEVLSKPLDGLPALVP